jgi:hypothetical protein
MGKGGGLNLLPHKKWNVYNRDNRLKVDNDEKIIHKELQRRKLNQREKTFQNKMKKLQFNKKTNLLSSKDDSINSENSFCNKLEDDNIKTQTYMELMKKESLLKQSTRFLNNKNNTLIPSSDKLINYEQIKTNNEIDHLIRNRRNNHLYEKEQIVKPSTFKETLNVNLKPWYTLPKPPLYICNNNHKEKLNQQKTLKELRGERISRETLEHNRIKELLLNKKHLK